MGRFVNPGNEGFRRILQGRYLDKMGIISLVNGVVGSAECLVCVTRPRRFGKSFAAQSLVAYFCCGCDSRELFDGLAISQDHSYERHLNAYNVVLLDVSRFVVLQGADVVESIRRELLGDLRREYGASTPTPVLRTPSCRRSKSRAGGSRSSSTNGTPPCARTRPMRLSAATWTS